MAAASFREGLPQSMSPSLTDGGGANQPSIWLSRPRHHVRLRCTARDACMTPAPLSQAVRSQR
eukprot:5671974-Prymnesium_polylepis.1